MTVDSDGFFLKSVHGQRNEDAHRGTNMFQLHPRYRRNLNLQGTSGAPFAMQLAETLHNAGVSHVPRQLPYKL